MINTKIDFYYEVKVSQTAPKKYHERIGVVLGISEENGVLYGYAVRLNDQEATVFFNKDDVVPTGKIYSKNDFY